MPTAPVIITTQQIKPIVIFGGTFNPIHLGHISPVIEAAKNLNAEKLIYLPCNIPPHKSTPSVTSQHRLDMTKLALQPYVSDGSENASLILEVSDYEIKQERTSYTRYTIEYFAAQYPNNPLFFLIGMDSLLQFTQWYRWQEILEFCQLLVIQRPNYQKDIDKLPDIVLKKTTFINTQLIDISSSEIRKQLSAHNEPPILTVSSQLPESIQQYIKQHKLYISR